LEKQRPNFSNTMRINLLPDVGGGIPGASVSGPTRGVGGKTGVVATSRPYRDLLESIYDAALVADEHGNVIEYNGRARAFLKYTAEQMGGLHIWDIIAGADEQTMEMILENLAAERFTLVQAYCLRSDASYFPAEIAVSRMRQDEDRFCLMIRDITVRREAEEQLLVEHNALKNAGNGVVIVDIAGSITYANPAFYQLLGVSVSGEASPLRGERLSVLGAGKQLEELVDDVFETKARVECELELPREGRTPVAVQVTVAANLNSEEELVGAVVSFMDLTDRRVVEQVRHEAEQQRVMLESMGTACHHLGQPATVLMTSMGLLRKRVGDVPEVDELLDRCDEMCTRLGKTLRQMQRLTKYKTQRYTDEGLQLILALEE
jgi:PAS domain S-box-containing protein